jgi:histidinol-phosphate aminotransferase
MSVLDPRSFVRPEVLALQRYHLELAPCAHKLDQNEAPYDLPRRLKRRVVDALVARSWANYPDFHADQLREALARRHGWPRDGVLVGNGSNELLSTVLEAVTRPGQEVVTASPSFGLYRAFATRAAAGLVTIAAGADLRLPLAGLLAAAAAEPMRPMILCSPNNPTGDAAPVEWVEQLLATLRAPLLLDNAYGEFCDRDYLPLLRRHRHLLLFRTFSKAWSLGGVRLGYLLADPDLVAELLKVKLPYNLGIFGSLAGLEALRADGAAARRIAAIRGRRPRWASMLRAHGFEVFASEANFLLARTPRGVDAGALWRALEACGIRVRDFTRVPALEGCLRFSVGSGRSLRAVDGALRDLIPDSVREARS